MELYMSEKCRALEIIKAKDLGYKPSESICILAKYYLYCENNTVEETEAKIIDFIKNKTSIYYCPSDWEMCITRNIKKAKKFPLVEIDCVDIAENEMNVIQSLKKKQMQRLTFTLLCLAKYHNIIFDKNNNWIDTPIFQVFKMANILGGTQRQRLLMMHELYVMKLISLSKRIDNLNIRVEYISEDSPTVLKITDMRELGKQYSKYCGDKYIKCEKCGVIFKPKTSTQKYCKDCAGYTPIGTKTVTCCDCGKEFEVDGIVKNKKRCDECQKEFRNNYQKELMRKKRMC